MSATYSTGGYDRAQMTHQVESRPRQQQRCARTGRPADHKPEKISKRERVRQRVEAAVTIATATFNEWMLHLVETAEREFEISPRDASLSDRGHWQMYYDLGCAPIGALIADQCRREAS